MEALTVQEVNSSSQTSFPTFREAFLSTRVAEVVRKVQRIGQLTQQDKAVLGRGRALLDRILEGSALIEGKPLKDGCQPTEAGIASVGYAISSLGGMQSVEQNLTDYFENLRSKLVAVETHQDQANDRDIDSIITFFVRLSKAYRGELKRQFYQEPKVS